MVKDKKIRVEYKKVYSEFKIDKDDPDEEFYILAYLVPKSEKESETNKADEEYKKEDISCYVVVSYLVGMYWWKIFLICLTSSILLTVAILFTCFKRHKDQYAQLKKEGNHERESLLKHADNNTN